MIPSHDSTEIIIAALEPITSLTCRWNTVPNRELWTAMNVVETLHYTEESVCDTDMS